MQHPRKTKNWVFTLSCLDHLANSVVPAWLFATAPLTTHAGFVAGHVRNVDWPTNRSGVLAPHTTVSGTGALLLKSSHVFCGEIRMGSNPIPSFNLYVCYMGHLNGFSPVSWIVSVEAHPLSDLATDMRRPQPSEHGSTLSVFPLHFRPSCSQVCKIGLQAHCTVTMMTSCETFQPSPDLVTSPNSIISRCPDSRNSASLWGFTRFQALTTKRMSGRHGFVSLV